MGFTDMRKRAKHSRDCLPVGTVVVRKRRAGAGKRRKLRYIKIRDGASGTRWIEYARFLWEEKHGPVPAGKRVIHLDGDSMNDEPANLDLGTPGDVAFLWHERCPDGSKRNYEKASAATAEHNRERARIRRSREFLKSKWYPVDFLRETIINRPCRKRWQVYGEAYRPRTGNAGKLDAAALGWPEEQFEWACVLTAIGQCGTPPNQQSIRELVARLRRQYGWRPQKTFKQRIYAVVSDLKARGMIVGFRLFGHRVYKLTAEARQLWQPMCEFVAVRGERLSTAMFERFRKIEAEEPALAKIS